MKRLIADGSVGFPHVRVGHCQALMLEPRRLGLRGFFMPVAGARLVKKLNSVIETSVIETRLPAGIVEFLFKYVIHRLIVRVF